jgi:Na+-translocating ferredoxin:NAD+ oxidoreductase RnfG subunit
MKCNSGSVLHFRRAARGTALGVAALLVGGLAAPAEARVFLGRADALAWAFPDAQIEERAFVLTEEQVRAVEAEAHRELDSRLVTFYTARRGGEAVGHALIDVHNVRTLPEAFLVVLTPEGEVRSLRVLAFYEPLEYLPPEGWLTQFEGKANGAPLRVDRDIHGIAGSTLSARAVAGGVRRAIALYRVLLAGGGSAGGH